MAVAPLRLLTTGFPSLLRDCLQQCHYPLLPIYTLHELENDVFEKEFYAKVFVPAKTSPQGWFFIGPPMPTRDLAIQQVAYEALLRLRDLLPEMKEEHATRYLPGKSGFGAPTQVMISPEDEDPTLKYQIRFVNAGDYLLRHLTEAFLKARQDLPSLLHLHCLEKKKVVEQEQQITALEAHISNQEQQIKELQKARNQTPRKRHRNGFPYPPHRGSSSGPRRQYPRLNSNPFASVTCHGCGELGHINRMCPNKQPTVACPLAPRRT